MNPLFSRCVPLLLIFLAGCGARSAVQPEATIEPRLAAATAIGSTEFPGSEAQLLAAISDENSVFFNPGFVAVDAAGEQTLQRHAQRLKADPKLVVTLTGHTDDQGSRSYNLAISEQRVNAVYQVLRRLGVPSSQLRRYGVGEEKMSPYCRSAECRQKMRRVELVYPK